MADNRQPSEPEKDPFAVKPLESQLQATPPAQRDSTSNSAY